MTTTFVFAKQDAALQTVWGWASVIMNEDGTPVVDSQGDVIEPQELQKAAHGFLLHSRDGGVMHEETGIATIVESLVTTKETVKALFPKVAEGLIPQGWAVAFKIHDKKVWKRVQDGELLAFSIGGVGEREEIEV